MPNFNIMKVLTNIKNIFSSLYWYRWRKSSKISDLKSLLSNSWDMVDSAFDLLIVKTEQVMTYIRDHGHEVRRYLDKSTIMANATKSDKLYIANKIITRAVREEKEHLIRIPYKVVDDSNSLSNKGTYYFEASLDEDDNLKYALVYEIAFKKKPFWKIPKNVRYFYVSETVDGIRHSKKVKNIQYYYKYNKLLYRNLNGVNNTFELVEKRLRECYNIPDLVDRIILSKSSFSLECEDLKHLSKELLKFKRGALYTYHEMWQFRKMLLECKTYNYDWPDEYYEAYNKLEDNDDEALKKLDEEFLSKKEEQVLKTFKFFIKHYSNWWD